MKFQESGRRILLVDADNIALAGRSDVDGAKALENMLEVSKIAGSVDVSLAVVSPRMNRRMASQQYFWIDNWTWRAAEQGPDAADHQLLEFAYHYAATEKVSEIVVASGDGIFAELAFVAPLRVVVPAGHQGVASRLQPWVERPAQPGTVLTLPRQRGISLVGEFEKSA